MVRQCDIASFMNGSYRRVLRRFACVFINDLENRFYRFTRGLLLLPACQRLCRSVHEGHMAVRVCRYHSIADTGECGFESLTLRPFCKFGIICTPQCSSL